MIVAKDLTKKFGKQVAVDSLNLSIEDGISYALLGPNGAGKTTTMKMLSALLAPTSGTVEIAGRPMSRNDIKIKEQIGMVSQHFSLHREMTVYEALKLHGMLHHMSKKEINENADKLLAFSGLDKDRNKLIGALSGGNKRKVMIIRAVMHNPKLLFLDEPTVGLDASIRRAIWDLLNRLKNDGMKIVLTTHYIEEAKVLCDRIGMMHSGRLIEENTPEGFMKMIEPYVVETFDGDTTKYEYFSDRNDAVRFISESEGSSLVRDTNLEDVYIKYTNNRIDK